MRSSQTLLRVLALPVLMLVVVAAGGQTTTYQATELGTLGGNDSEAYAINDYGQVVGRALDLNGVPHMFHWQNGELLDLAVELRWGWRSQQLDYNVGYGISNTDHVVGATQCSPNGVPQPDAVGSDVPGGAYLHACIFRPAVTTDLGSPFPGESLTFLGTFVNTETTQSSAVDISRNGQYIVGWSDLDTNNRIHAFLATPVNGVWATDGITCKNPQNALLQDLGTLPTYDENSSATAVNRLGQVVGWSYSRTYGYHAFVWQNGVMTDLGTLGGGTENNSWARDINDSGMIVGESDVGDWMTHAFIWTPQTQRMIDLGTLGGESSSACAINSSGQVVGWSLDGQNQKRAFLITPQDTDGDGKPDQWFADGDGSGINHLMTDLNDLVQSGFRVRMTEGRDINDSRSEIVGFGMIGTGADAQEMAFVLTPSGAAAGGGGSAAGGTHQDAVLEPVQANGNGGSDNNGAGNGSDQTTGVLPLTPLHFLCGTGFANMLPLMLAGLCAVKFGVRRR